MSAHIKPAHQGRHQGFYEALAELQRCESAEERLSAALEGGRAIVGVVGARRADRYGLELTKQLTTFAAERGALILSGGAQGVDITAHERALELGAPSVAVLGVGLKRAPARLKPLCERGLGLVSPFLEDVRGARWRFAKRNEHLARLCDLLLVTQAGLKSGSLITARYALRLGRPVWVAPGPLESPHEGCYQLLQEGAKVITSQHEWLLELDHLSSRLSPSMAHQLPLSQLPLSQPAPQVSVSSLPHDPLSLKGIGKPPAPMPPPGPAPSSALWAAASEQAESLAELAERARLPLGRALSEATMLELEGWLIAAPGGRYARVEPSPA